MCLVANDNTCSYTLQLLELVRKFEAEQKEPDFEIISSIHVKLILAMKEDLLSYPVPRPVKKPWWRANTKRLVRVLAGLDEKHWVLLEEKLKEIVGVQQAPPVSSKPNIYMEADAVAATTRQQFILEKKAEGASSASPSDTRNDGAKMA